MAIKPVEMLCAKSKYSMKCPYTMTPTRIVVHNTANDASARNEVSYMISNNAECSFHFAVDNNEVVQGIPLNRNAWHAGDGNGNGNRKGIGIEICYSLSGGSKFTAAEKLAAKFIAQLLDERGWGIEKVTKHQDYSGKYCPHRTLDLGWNRFLNLVKTELTALQKPTESESLKKNKTAVQKRYGFTDGTITFLSGHKAPESLFSKLADTSRKPVESAEKTLSGLKKQVKNRFNFTDGTMTFLVGHKTPEALLKKLATKE